MEKISSVRAVVSPSSRFDSRTSEEPRDRNKVYSCLLLHHALDTYNIRQGKILHVDFTNIPGQGFEPKQSVYKSDRFSMYLKRKVEHFEYNHKVNIP